MLEFVWSDWRVGLAAAAALAVGAALLSAWLTPRGPITTPEALVSMASALALTPTRYSWPAAPGHVFLVLLHSPPDSNTFFGLEAPPDGIHDVLMTPAELFVLARAEAGEPQTIPEYAVASSANVLEMD